MRQQQKPQINGAQAPFLLTDKMLWKTTRFEINLVTPKVMGIVNVTPDSFSDGRKHANLSSALKHCELLLKQGCGYLGHWR